MQRKNVLFPDPDGPIMHITSRGCTSRLMPRSTSRRPKFLCTASAFTMGAFISTVLARKGDWLFRNGRREVESEQQAPEALDRRRRKFSLGTSGEVALDVVLADGEERGHEEIPDRGYDRQFDDREGALRDLIGAGEKVAH